MDAYYKSIIKDIADKARAKVKGGQLFGQPIDMNDPDMVIAAVYTVATHEEQHKAAEDLDRVLSLFRGQR